MGQPHGTRSLGAIWIKDGGPCNLLSASISPLAKVYHHGIPVSLPNENFQDYCLIRFTRSKNQQKYIDHLKK